MAMGSTGSGNDDLDDSERARAAHAAAGFTAAGFASAGLSAAGANAATALNASTKGGAALSLRWHDYSEAVVSTLRMLKEDEDFVDVTLACNSSQQFTAHKVVLSACSPYFRKLLKTCGSSHPIIVLSNVSEDDLRALLKFMYNGQVQIAEEHLKDFLKTAEALQIRGLTDGTATRDNANLAQAQSPIAAPPSRGSSGLSLEPQPFARHQGYDNLNIHDNGLPPSDVFGPPSAKRYKTNGPRSENSSPGIAADRNRWMMREAQSADAIGTSLLSQALEKQSGMRSAELTQLADAMKDDHHRRQMEQDAEDEDDEDEASDVTSERPDSLIDGLVKSESLGAGGLSELGNGLGGSALHRQLSSPATTSASNPLFPPALEALYRQAGFPPAFLGLAAGAGGPPNGPGSALSVQSVGLQSHAGNPNSKLDMMRVRATDPRPCPKCGKIYRSAHTLRTHMEDKHTICTGYRCVLCGTVAKSRNSLHSHMSRQHRGISTKDLPVLPMPSPFDADLASRLLAKAGVKVSPSELAARASPTATRRGDSHKMESGGGGFMQHMQQQFPLPSSLSASSTSGLLHPGDVEDLRMTPASSPFGGHRASPSLATHIRSPTNITAKDFAAMAGGAAAGLGPAAAAAAAAAGGMGSALLDTYLQMIAAAGANDGGMAAAFGFQNPASRAAAFAAAAAAAANAGNGAPPTNGDGRRSDDSRRSYSVEREEDLTGELGSDAENDEEEGTSDPDGDAAADSLDRAKLRLEEAAGGAPTATTMGSN